MPEYLSPGIYIEEVDKGPRPIEGVGTAMAAFVGFAPAGPINKPTLITNWSQYVGTFGALDEGQNPPRKEAHCDGMFMSHAVFGYFMNGGSRCWVSRVPIPGASAAASTIAIPELRGTRAALHLVAKQPDEITVSLAPAGDSEDKGFITVTVRSGGAEQRFERISLDAKSERFITTVINRDSPLITVSKVIGVPKPGRYVLPAKTGIARIDPNSFIGTASERSGVHGLEIAEDATMVCCPDVLAAYQSGAIDKLGVQAIQGAMMTHCALMGDRVAIIDPLPDLSPQEVLEWRQQQANYDSKYAALYYPWLTIMGHKGKPIEVPPSGHVAGVWARNDAERGVHKAPANEAVRNTLSPTMQITKGEQALLNPVGINCIRTFTGAGIRVWGARTLSSESAWRYVNVRRLFNYVEKSIEQGTQWVVFEPNDPDLWARVRRDVSAFLTGVWRDGALFGSSPAEAFYVKCDAELNPTEVRDQGRLIIEIGMAPVKPAEFVIFRMSQWSGGGA